MEETVEFPDAELAHSPTHGKIFRVPKLAINNDDIGEKVDSTKDVGRRVIIRPQSAKGIYRFLHLTLPFFC